ncbi:DNA binding protein isoform X2 [Wolffia australiana]
MAPTRKPRVIHPRFKRAEDSPEKDGHNSNKSKTKKRKLSDMLGSQWSKEELERFYTAYRKHGKDWKKVAGSIRNRTVEMVEALFNMNRAYLSLPEGTATVAGLTAMMTDHYNILEGTDSDDDSNEPQTSSKPQKRLRGKFPPVKGTSNLPPDFSPYQSTTANYGCLSLLKKKRSGGNSTVLGNKPRAVGKRTPRFPVPCTYDREALAEASQRAGSPQVSRTPLKAEQTKPSPVHSGERKMDGHWKNDYCSEGSLGSVEAETGGFAGEIGYRHDSESGHPSEIKKFRKAKGCNSTAVGFEDNILDEDVREACSGTEEGPSNRSSKAEIDSEASGRKGGTRKRNRQLFSGDESAALDALQTLADLSFNILLPGAAVESESSVQPKDANVAEKSGIAGLSAREKKDKSKSAKKKVGPLLSTRRGAKQKEVSPDEKNLSEVNNQLPVRRYRKKNLKDEESEGIVPAESPVQEPKAEELKKSVGRGKGGTHLTSQKPGKMLKPQEPASSGSEISRKPTDEKESTAQVPGENKRIHTLKHTNRRKAFLKTALSQGVKRSASDETSEIKARLSNCLSSPLLRRWCMFEWFYSAIDYPWFAKSEFVEYLDHVGLGHIPRLTRVEWGVIRSSLGKPRRLSAQFLREERDKLEEYRESVRAHYAELRSGSREGLPTDLARPLAVGQRVVACHPKTREIHDGSILTVDRNRCRVQFDRPELGVEFVMDIDCMPLNPSENMPDALRKKSLVLDKVSESFYEARQFSQAPDGRLGEPTRLFSSENLDNTEGVCSTAPPTYPINTLIKQANGDTIDAIAVAKAAASEVAAAAQQAMYAQPCTLAHIQAREADLKALAELTRALDKKEALLTELRNMNEEVSTKQKDGEPIKEFDHFRKQYAMVLLQLRDANDQVAGALVFLRQRNTYLGNGVNAGSGAGGNGGQIGHSTCPGFQEPPGSHILDIIQGSRRKARALVDVATNAMPRVKKGEDAFDRIGEALDEAKPPGTSGTSPEDHVRRSDGDAWVPGDLISSCVAALIMIQTCAERQDPPADVAQILDSAVSTLEPCCPQNLPIFREIESFMGIVKNQVLAKVPSLSSLPIAELHS